MGQTKQMPLREEGCSVIHLALWSLQHPDQLLAFSQTTLGLPLLGGSSGSNCSQDVDEADLDKKGCVLSLTCAIQLALRATDQILILLYSLGDTESQNPLESLYCSL